MTEEKIYNDYQEYSGRAGDRAAQVAWALIIMQTGAFIGGKSGDGLLMAAVLAVLYLLLSAMQSLWQAVSIWLFRQYVHRECSRYQQMTVVTDYPDWVGGGAWCFYWAKMAVAVGAVLCFIVSVF